MKKEVREITVNRELKWTKVTLEDDEEVIFIRKDEIEKIKDYIKDKLRKSLEYDLCLHNNRCDRLFTETTVELQKIEDMIDKLLEG